jgi:hypothetical protein
MQKIPPVEQVVALHRGYAAWNDREMLAAELAGVPARVHFLAARVKVQAYPDLPSRQLWARVELECRVA